MPKDLLADDCNRMMQRFAVVAQFRLSADVKESIAVLRDVVRDRFGKLLQTNKLVAVLAAPTNVRTDLHDVGDSLVKRVRHV